MPRKRQKKLQINNFYIMKYQTYTKYKPSGIEWIGDIPKDWEVRKMKFLLSTIQSGNREKGGGSIHEKGVFSLGGEHVGWNGELKYENLKLISEEYYNSLNQGKINVGDTLLVKDGATIGKTAFLYKKKFEKMAVNEHVFLMRANNLFIPKIIYYLVCGELGFKQIKLTETGSAQGGINLEFPDKVLFSVSLNKNIQQGIVDFLDKKIGQIDDLIKKDKKLIEFLKEKRIALINKAVTKGLDDNVKLKDSGIDWIGKIPEDWGMDRLKFLTSKSAQYGAGEEPEFNEKKFDFRYVRITDVDDKGCLKKDSVAYLSKEEARGYVLKEGDILFARSGATVGKVYYYLKKDGKCCFAGYMIRYVVSDSTLNSKFLLYFSLSKSYKEWIKIISTQSTIENVSAEKYNDLVVSLPSVKEQHIITKYLDKQTEKIDKTVEVIEKRIKLLEEYKKSLIYNAVTGKIKV